MKIFLVDFFLNGHHLDHVVYHSRYLLEFGHEVTFATWQQDSALQTLRNIGVNVCYVGAGQRRLASYTLQMIPQFARGVRKCFQIAEREDADIIHLLYVDRAVLLPLWWNSFWSTFRVPVFATLLSPYHFIDNPDLSQLEHLYHRLVRRTLKTLLLTGKLAGLFVVTERIKHIILLSLGVKHLENRLFVTPDPLPDPTYPGADNSKQSSRKRLGLPVERTILLFFGELRENKGPDILLKAVRLLPSEVLVVFAGRPAGSFSLRDWEQEVLANGVDGQTRLDLGHIPDELVPVYFGAADAIVLPYRRSFLATSGVLQWAAAAQKPVIATDVGEIGDLVKRYELGLVTEPENPRVLAGTIIDYLRQRELLERTSAERRPEYIFLNHWRRTAEVVLAGYETAIPRS
jgi:glycosyltransferase involved in cell wall biosynthesis